MTDPLALWKLDDVDNRAAQELTAWECSKGATFIDNRDVLKRLRTANVVRRMAVHTLGAPWSVLEAASSAAEDVWHLMCLLKDVQGGTGVTKASLRKAIADAIIHLDMTAFLFAIDVPQAIEDTFNEAADESGRRDIHL